jgi:hypothetical protein
VADIDRSAPVRLFSLALFICKIHVSGQVASGRVHDRFRAGCDKGLRAFAIGPAPDRGSIVDLAGAGDRPGLFFATRAPIRLAARPRRLDARPRLR